VNRIVDVMPIRNKRPNFEWTGSMSLQRSQIRCSQRKRHAAGLIRKMANWYYSFERALA
jgi:hypothetical protein